MIQGFPAYAQTPQDHRRSISGTVRVQAGAVVFLEIAETGNPPPSSGERSGDRVEIRLPIDKLRVRLAGTKEETLVLEHPSVPEATLWSDSPQFRRHLQSLAQPELSQQFEQLRFRSRRRIGVLVGLLVVLGALIGGALVLRAYVRGPFLERIPGEWEQSIGHASFDMLISPEELVDDPEVHALLEPITQPLVQAAGTPRYDFRFHILKNESINAFALPGGTIVLHTGLLLEAERPEEIAGVVAHEIAHVVRQHSLRSLVDRLGTLGMLQILFGDATGLLALVTDGGAELLMQKYSRSQETEADRLGIHYLGTAGIDPRGLVEFLSRVEALEASNPMARMEILNTHPSRPNASATPRAKSRRCPGSATRRSAWTWVASRRSLGPTPPSPLCRMGRVFSRLLQRCNE